MSTILTIDKLKEIGPISSALGNQVELLQPFVEFAEQSTLREDILGEALYDSIIGEIEAGTLSGYNQTLVENYLYNLSSWQSFFEASPFILYRASAKGITKQFSDNSQSVDTQEFSSFRQSILDKVSFWRGATLRYLENNSTHFPTWRTQYYGKTETQYPQDDFSGGIYV